MKAIDRASLTLLRNGKDPRNEGLRWLVERVLQALDERDAEQGVEAPCSASSSGTTLIEYDSFGRVCAVH